MKRPPGMGFVKVETFLQGTFEGGRCLEADSLGCLDLHGFSSLWVAAHTSSALLDFKSAESDELDLAILLNAFGNGLKDCCDRIFCCALGCFLAEVLLDEFNEFCFVHSVLGFL